MELSLFVLYETERGHPSSTYVYFQLCAIQCVLVLNIVGVHKVCLGAAV